MPLQKLDLVATQRQIKQQGFERWLLEALTSAFVVARKGKTKTYDENAFDTHWVENLYTLCQAILQRTYRPGASLTFIIYEPMIREIFAAPFKDRVVHHFLYNMVAEWWDQRFIDDSYSCRVGKGTLYGVQRLQEKMRLATNNFTEKGWILKLDLSGYFMSLRRKDLYQLVIGGLDQQFAEAKHTPEGRQLYHTCKFLWKQVIFDDPVLQAVRRGSERDWDALPPRKSLFCQPPGQGIVIGNLTSQLMSNIMLNQLDHYVTEELGYQYYGRYVDDFYIVVPDKDRWHLKNDIKKIDAYLKSKHLTLHPKKRYFQPVHRGVSFLGARVYPHCLYPSDRLQHRFFDAAYMCAAGERDVDSIIAYMGMMHHLDGKKYTQKVFDSVGWRYRS